MVNMYQVQTQTQQAEFSGKHVAKLRVQPQTQEHLETGANLVCSKLACGAAKWCAVWWSSYTRECTDNIIS